MNQAIDEENSPQHVHADPGMPVLDPGEYGGRAPSQRERTSADADEWMRLVDENAQVWAAQARDSIREHPLGAVAGALVAGLLLARLMR